MRVTYRQLFPAWHEKSRPQIESVEGELLAVIPQFVDHPGLYDERADRIANTLVGCWELAKRLLNPEELGMAVPAHVRDEARKALGMKAVEVA